MGNECLASTPVEHYRRYANNSESYFDIKVSEIKDYWTTLQVYKIKKLYDSVATKNPEYQKHTHLELNNFIKLFPEIQNYPEVAKMLFRGKRIESLRCSISTAMALWTGTTFIP